MQESEQWVEGVIADGRLDSEGRLTVRSVSDVVVPRQVVVDNIFFTGLYVLRCYGGRFRFMFSERDPIDLPAGELLVIYPGNTVTVKALEQTNHLMFCIFKGTGVVPFFDGLGFFDWIHGRTTPRIEGFNVLRRLVKEAADKGDEGRAAARVYLQDILVSQLQDLKRARHPLLYAAVHQIHVNLRKGLVRLDPLCAALGVSRSHLHSVFAENGLPNPSDLIRWCQLRLAVRLLRKGNLTPSEVAERAGFISPSHFATFIKRHTGRTPREIRQAAEPLPGTYHIQRRKEV